MGYSMQGLQKPWRPKPTIPARPLRWALIDRATGAMYRVKPNLAETAPELQVVARVPTPWVSAVIDAYVVGDTGWQLYVSNAALLTELAPTGVKGARALVWLGRKVFNIGVTATGTLTWEQVV